MENNTKKRIDQKEIDNIYSTLKNDTEPYFKSKFEHIKSKLDIFNSLGMIFIFIDFINEYENKNNIDVKFYFEKNDGQTIDLRDYYLDEI